MPVLSKQQFKQQAEEKGHYSIVVPHDDSLSRRGLSEAAATHYVRNELPLNTLHEFHYDGPDRFWEGLV